MWAKVLALTALLAWCFVTSGCGSCGAGTSIGTAYNASSVNRIVIGQTTRAQVLDLFGPVYIQEEAPNTIRYVRGAAEAKASLWRLSCKSWSQGIRIRFEDDVVSGYDLIGRQ